MKLPFEHPKRTLVVILSSIIYPFSKGFTAVLVFLVGFINLSSIVFERFRELRTKARKSAPLTPKPHLPSQPEKPIDIKAILAAHQLPLSFSPQPAAKKIQIEFKGIEALLDNFLGISYLSASSKKEAQPPQPSPNKRSNEDKPYLPSKKLKS